MVDFPKKTLADWTTLATKDTGGASPDTLVWDTPEGIPVKPLYTADDLAGLELDTLPGFAPYTRGPRATMYSHRPWTIRPRTIRRRSFSVRPRRVGLRPIRASRAWAV